MSVVLCLPAHLHVSRSVPWPAPHGNASVGVDWFVRVEACVFGAFECQDWSTQSYSTFGSPVPGSSLDDLDVQVFGLDVQELSTHAGAEQKKEDQSSYPV